MQERSVKLNTNRDLLDTRTVVLDEGDPELVFFKHLDRK